MIIMSVSISIFACWAWPPLPLWEGGGGALCWLKSGLDGPVVSQPEGEAVGVTVGEAVGRAVKFQVLEIQVKGLVKNPVNFLSSPQDPWNFTS